MTNFAGHDELEAAFNAVGVTLLSSVALAMALTGTTAAWVAWLVGVLLTPVAYFGARYRLTVGPDGIELVRYRCWPIWRQRTNFYLDAEVSLYEAWDSDRVEGLCLTSPDFGEPDSESFGPYWSSDRVRALQAQVTSAISSARSEAVRTREPRVRGLAGARFEVLERSPGGAPRSARNLEFVNVLGTEIPPGSTFSLNRDGWVDPARTDVINTVEVAEPFALPNGVRLPSSTALSFSTTRPAQLTVTQGLGTTQRIGDIAIDGADSVTFDSANAYAPVEFTLAASLLRSEVTLPAGTRVETTWVLDPGWWRATLGSPVELSGTWFYAGDTLTFDPKWRPKFASVRRPSLVAEGVTLEGNLSAIPLRRGRVDVRECKRNGLLAK